MAQKWMSMYPSTIAEWRTHIKEIIIKEKIYFLTLRLPIENLRIFGRGGWIFWTVC